MHFESKAQHQQHYARKLAAAAMTPVNWPHDSYALSGRHDVGVKLHCFPKRHLEINAMSQHLKDRALDDKWLIVPC